MIDLTDQIVKHRLAAHHIATAPFDKLEEAVRNLMAMQSQDYAGGLWSIALRTKDATLQDVEQAIKDREIVRTWPMRGTLHFMHADDVHWMVDVLALRAYAAGDNRRREIVGLSDDVMKDVAAALQDILSDQPVRRDTLRDELKNRSNQLISIAKSLGTYCVTTAKKA